MKLFDKRPLSLILCILLGSFVFFSFGEKSVRIFLICAAALLLLIPLFVSGFLRNQRIKIIVAASLILFASLLSYIYFDLWFYADRRFGEDARIKGTVEEFDFSNGINTLTVSTDSINEKEFSDYKIRVSLENNDFTNITLGTKISFVADIFAFESSDDFDAADYYYSRGYSAIAENVENLQVEGQENTSFVHKITEYRKSLSRKFVLYSNERCGGLLAALILGDREFLSNQIRLDFSRIGISHILALSGMHLAILCLGFSKLLSLFGLGKKMRKVSEILFALFYMYITGFPVSVVRAGLMLILSAILFLLSSTKDSVTNLFIAVTLIVIVQPYSVFDISLWLSAFATLGIIIFSEITEKRNVSVSKGAKCKLLSLFSPFLSTVFAIGTTALISHLSFNSISSLSLFSTFIFSPIFYVFIYLGTFFLFTASFIPLGNILTFFGDFVIDFAHSLSSLKFSLLSTSFWLTKVLIILFTIFLFFFIILDFRKRKTSVAVILLLLISSVLSAGFYTANQASVFSFEYNEQEERERILMKCDFDACLVEISNPSKKVSYESIKYLKENDIYYLKSYVITAYNTKTTEALEVMLSGVFIENIYLSAPQNSEQKEIYSEILKLKNVYEINIITYVPDKKIEFSDFSLYPVFCDNKGKFAITIKYNDEFYSYVTADMLEESTRNHALKIMYGANTVIIGAKGENSNSDPFIYKISGDTRLIYNKKSGLTDEILKYYENRITADPSGKIDLYVE